MIYPEYEACKKIAESAQIPLQQVYRAVTSVALSEDRE
jgi:uncharacterized protein (DUF111 family)